jgi:hypothetical protein
MSTALVGSLALSRPFKANLKNLSALVAVVAC